MASEAARRRKSLSISAQLAIASILIALPLLGGLVYLVDYSSTQQHRQVENRLAQVLNDLVNDFDRDLDRDLVLLDTLATSPLIAQRDWRGFHEQATAALQGRAYLVLVDPAGRQIVNTYVPYGRQPEMTGDMDTLRRIRETREPVFSNLFVSKVVQQPVLNVSIPVLAGNEVVYVMSLGILSQHMSKILDGLSLDKEWVTSMWDARGALIARSRNVERFLGVELPPRLRPEDRSRVIYRTTDLDGEPVLRIVGRSLRSGWGVAANVSAAYVDSQLDAGWRALAGTTVIAALLAAFSAMLASRLIARPLRLARRAARDLGRGKRPIPLVSRLAEANEISRALVAAYDEIEKREAALAESERQLSALVEMLPIGIGLVDTDGRVLISNAVFRQLVHERLPSIDDERWFLWKAIDAKGHPLPREQYPVRRALGGQTTWPGTEFLYLGDPERGPFWTRVSALPFRDVHGKIVGATAVIEDIDDEKRAAEERRRAEEQRTTLIGELNHRVKNTLAIVQAIAFQTFRTSGPGEQAVESFHARLLALSAAHDVLTRRNWEGASLNEIVSAVVAPHRGGAAARFEIHGPEVTFMPRQALAISMVLHELCTNSAKYGALSTSTGRVEIAWSAENEAGRRFGLRWQESGGPPVRAPMRKGFGTMLIEEMLKRDLDAEVTLSWPVEGLICTIDALAGF